MKKSNVKCEYSCRASCTALREAIEQEKSAILRYGKYRDECVYTEVRNILNELILRHQRIIQELENTQASLNSRFAVLGQIQDSFDS